MRSSNWGTITHTPARTRTTGARGVWWPRLKVGRVPIPAVITPRIGRTVGLWNWERERYVDEVENAEIEQPEDDESKFIDSHWLLILGLGLVGIGLLIRWWVKRR